MGTSVTAVLKALSNPNRRKVYQIICRRGADGRKGITIEQICKAAGMKQPAVSHHVARLAAAGLVSRTKARWWVHCAPSRDGLDALARFSRDPASFPLE
jgi:DNA-binding transcriptional ArsR family regulator